MNFIFKTSNDQDWIALLATLARIAIALETLAKNSATDPAALARLTTQVKQDTAKLQGALPKTAR